MFLILFKKKSNILCIMNNTQLINNIHHFFIIYLFMGGILESHRSFLVLLIPTLQFQFLLNDNKCILTQLEERLINNERNEDNKKELQLDTFVNRKLLEYNININPVIKDRLIHTTLYFLFLGNYFMM